MGIQINGQTDTISATDGSFTIQGATLPTAEVTNLNATGIVTATSFSGPLTGNVTGNLTGTASTATAAATAYGLSGSPTLSGITSISTTNLTVNGNAYPSSGPLSNRNKIINGDMRIDQRNAGASVTLGSNGAYPVDRFFCVEDSDGVMTAQQSTSAPAGFSNSIRFTTTTADSSLTGGQFACIQQMVEGYNVANLNFGTANAQTFTLSFWVRSSLTGTFGGSVANGAHDRSYAFTYSISSANTWEYKTITIAGDTSGTWLTTNGKGLKITWGLGVGSSYSGTAGSWNSAVYLSATSAVSVIGTLNATFDITGVQLEAGSVATPFEHRNYGNELARCQRYCQVHDVSGSGELIAHGVGNGTTTSSQIIRPFVPFRSAPALTISSAGDFQIQFVGSATTTTCSSLSLITGTTSSNYVYIDCAITGGTAGQGQYLRSQNANAVLTLSAEL